MKICFEIQKMRTRGYFAFCKSNIDLSVCGRSIEDLREKILSSVECYMKKHPELDADPLEISAKVIPLTPQ